MDDMQKLVDAMGDIARDTRADYHLTLGATIEQLSRMSGESQVRFDWSDFYAPGKPFSYRGYYSDLAFDPCDDVIRVSRFLTDCEAALGETFQGYKGGDFMMDERTPLWSASYNTTSGARAIIGLEEMAGEIIVLTKAIED